MPKAPMFITVKFDKKMKAAINSLNRHVDGLEERIARLERRISKGAGKR